MCRVAQLCVGCDNFLLEGYILPGEKDWCEAVLKNLRGEIPNSHYLLTAIAMTQECSALRERSCKALAVVLAEYESLLGQVHAVRARTFFVAAITELKMILDELKRQPQSEKYKVLLRLSEHFGCDALKLDTSFEGMEQVYLLSDPNIGNQWMLLRRHA